MAGAFVAAALGGGAFLLRPVKVRVAIAIAGDIGSGQVISEPMGIDCGDICSGRFKKGEPLSLVAKPAPNYVFVGWAGVWRLKGREPELIRLLAVDPHAPAEFRANVVRNLEEFYEAFGVVEGDRLWLPAEQRVRIW